MNTHQICENWILEESKLNQEDSAILQQHLRGCENCRDLDNRIRQTDALFAAAITYAPRPGFTKSWLELKHKREAEQRRQESTRIVFGIFFLIGVLCLGFCLTLFIPEVFSFVLNRFSDLLTFIAKLFNKIEAILILLQKPARIFGIASLIGMALYVVSLLFSAVFIHNFQTKKENLDYERNC